MSSDINTKQLFVASYLSKAEIGRRGLDYTINLEAVWADSPEEVLGILQTDLTYKHKRPIDMQGIKVIEITEAFALEVVARTKMF